MKHNKRSHSLEHDLGFCKKSENLEAAKSPDETVYSTDCLDSIGLIVECIDALIFKAAICM